MSDGDFPRPAASALASAAASAHAPSFAEAQRRLAARRRERAAAAEAERRARAAAAAAAGAPRRSGSAAAAAAPPSSAHPLLRRLGTTAVGSAAVGAWEGVLRAGTTAALVAGQALGGGGGGGGGADAADAADVLDTRRRPAFRVSQVDAELLDEELLELLRGQVGDALRYVRGGTLADDWQPEIMLLLRAALFKLSVWDHDATYGAALQNLRFADARGRAPAGKTATATAATMVSREAVPVPPSKWQKALYGLVSVGGRYAWVKWEDWLRNHDEDEDEDGDDAGGGGDEQTGGRRWLTLTPATVRRLARATQAASNVYAGAAFVSFLVFLRYGRYRTLLDRVLRMRLVPPTSQVSREVSFEYLNRQLVWHAFTEFLLFLLPLVGIHRWRRWMTRTWRKTKRGLAQVAAQVRGGGRADEKGGEDGGGGGGGGGGGDDEEEAAKTGEYAFLPERTCAICYQDQNAATTEADVLAAAAASSGVIGSAETDITNPYEAIPCGCVYCYVSLATRLEREEGDGWTCLRCGTLVTACRPWHGDVLEPASSAAAPGGVGGAGDDLASASAAAAAAATAAAPSATPAARPSSSSTTASYTQKTVGFADDVKGDEPHEGSSEGESYNAADVDADDADEADEADEAETTSSDSESEAYEDDEDGALGEADDDYEE